MASDSRRTLELIATSVGVAAVLLPISGVVVREVAFWSLNLGDVGEIVLGAPVGTLAATGFLALVLAVPFVLALVATFRTAPLLRRIGLLRPRLDRIRREAETVKSEQTKLGAELEAAERELEAEEPSESEITALRGRLQSLRERSWEFASRAESFSKEVDAFGESAEWKHLSEAADRSWLAKHARVAAVVHRLPSWTVDVVLLLLVVALGTFSFSWPTAVPLVVAWVVGVFVAPWVAERTDLFQFVGVVVSTALVLVLVAIAAGLAGLTGTVYVANYTFKPDASLPSGRYAHLADFDGFVALQSCASLEVVTVDASSVAHIDEAPPKMLPARPTLWDVAALGRSPVIGYRSGC